MLGERVTLANPLDYHTYVWGDADAMSDGVHAMVRGPADLHLLFADLPRADRCADDDWVLAVDAFARACAAADARGALVAAMAGNLTGERAAAWVRRGLAVLAPPAVAVAAVEAAADDRPGLGGSAAPPSPVAGPPSRRCPAARPCSTRPRASGCSAPTGCRCLPGRCARARAPRWSRPPTSAGPVAVKGLGIAHKTEHRAVRLGLVEPDDVRAAAAVLLARYPAVLVERLVPGGIVELLVGVQSDPVFGPVLSLGVGGVLTELVRDVAHLLLPADAGRDPPGAARPALRPAAHRLPRRTAGRPGRRGRRRRPGGRAGAGAPGGGRAGDQPVDRHAPTGPGPATRWW